MVNITRFNPLEDTFENLFRGVPMWLPVPETRAPAPTQFRMDVTENDKEYQVLAELPGVKKEEISITINGNEVLVSAEVKHEEDRRRSWQSRSIHETRCSKRERRLLRGMGSKHW